MHYIKVFGEKQCRVSIRTDHYGSTLAKFLDLFKQLKKDFPAARPDQVEIVHYGGERFKHIWGIEYTVKNAESVPSSYQHWSSLETTLSPRGISNKKHAFAKMYEPHSNHCLIRTLEPGNSLQVFLDFFRELRKDFPRLGEKDVELKNYAGNKYRYTFGMEFPTPRGFNVPSTYIRIEMLEYTL